MHSLFMVAAILPGFSTAIQPKSDPVGWIAYSDYPAAALERDEQGHVGARLEIAPDGKPSGCDIISPSGSKLLDEATCLLLLKRAIFRPVTTREGQPIAGVLIRGVTWSIYEKKRIVAPPHVDLDFTVKALPEKMPSPAVVNLQIIVDEKGVVESCLPDWGDALPALGGVACQQVSASLRRRPAHNVEGVPVRSIQVARVQFTVEPAKAN